MHIIIKEKYIILCNSVLSQNIQSLKRINQYIIECIPHIFHYMITVLEDLRIVLILSSIVVSF